MILSGPKFEKKNWGYSHPDGVLKRSCVLAAEIWKRKAGKVMCVYSNKSFD
jgi:hypothetical protein